MPRGNDVEITPDGWDWLTGSDLTGKKAERIAKAQEHEARIRVLDVEAQAREQEAANAAKTHDTHDFYNFLSAVHSGGVNTPAAQELLQAPVFRRQGVSGAVMSPDGTLHFTTASGRPAYLWSPYQQQSQDGSTVTSYREDTSSPLRYTPEQRLALLQSAVKPDVKTMGKRAITTYAGLPQSAGQTITPEPDTITSSAPGHELLRTAPGGVPQVLHTTPQAPTRSSMSDEYRQQQLDLARQRMANDGRRADALDARTSQQMSAQREAEAAREIDNVFGSPYGRGTDPQKRVQRDQVLSETMNRLRDPAQAGRAPRGVVSDVIRDLNVPLTRPPAPPPAPEPSMWQAIKNAIGGTQAPVVQTDEPVPGSAHGGRVGRRGVGMLPPSPVHASWGGKSPSERIGGTLGGEEGFATGVPVAYSIAGAADKSPWTIEEGLRSPITAAEQVGKALPSVDLDTAAAHAGEFYHGDVLPAADTAAAHAGEWYHGEALPALDTAAAHAGEAYHGAILPGLEHMAGQVAPILGDIAASPLFVPLLAAGYLASSTAGGQAAGENIAKRLTSASGGKVDRLTAGDRADLQDATFGLPVQRKYPMPDRSHAANAKARATQQVNAGNLTPAQKAQIDAKANRMLKVAKGGTVNANEEIREPVGPEEMEPAMSPTMPGKMPMMSGKMPMRPRRNGTGMTSIRGPVPSKPRRGMPVHADAGGVIDYMKENPWKSAAIGLGGLAAAPLAMPALGTAASALVGGADAVGSGVAHAATQIPKIAMDIASNVGETPQNVMNWLGDIGGGAGAALSQEGGAVRAAEGGAQNAPSAAYPDLVNQIARRTGERPENVATWLGKVASPPAETPGPAEAAPPVHMAAGGSPLSRFAGREAMAALLASAGDNGPGQQPIHPALAIPPRFLRRRPPVPVPAQAARGGAVRAAGGGSFLQRSLPGGRMFGGAAPPSGAALMNGPLPGGGMFGGAAQPGSGFSTMPMPNGPMFGGTIGAGNGFSTMPMPTGPRFGASIGTGTPPAAGSGFRMFRSFARPRFGSGMALPSSGVY